MAANPQSTSSAKWAPTSEQDLAQVLIEASEPLTICGGSTRHKAGSPALSTSNLTGIKLYEPGALTIVAAAGTPVQEIAQVLAQNGQCLAFEPMDHRRLLGTEGTPTIGGVVAANVSGPRRIQAGACRDYLLGVRFVDGAGRLVKNGGRVMKNVTGYDLARLMAGSRGQLGVLTEVGLKVLPAPETRACLLIDGLEDSQAIDVMSQALGSPFDVTGAVHIPVGLAGHPVTMLRIEGFADSVAYRLNQLTRMFTHLDLRREENPEQVDVGWRWVRNVETFVGKPGDVWRISCQPSKGPSLAAALPQAEILYDWGGGLIWARVPAGLDLRAALPAFSGHATLVRGSGVAQQPQGAAIDALTQALRGKFDPKNLFQTAKAVP